jgi:histidinol-phosphate aminotransferase|tara:strand:+ start:26814 stop:27851 length:1038 start_codon:yes stop_codon:yes gene_type:complete
MKNWLLEIERKFDTEDKSRYYHILNQSERTTPIPGFQAFLQTITQEDFMYYPNTEKFKKQLSRYCQVDVKKLFLCNGSDFGLRCIFQAFLDDYQNIVSTTPSFPMYKVYTELEQCYVKTVAHEKDYTIDIEKFKDTINNHTGLIVLANPNSPMGELKSHEEILSIFDNQFVKKFKLPVVIDEAYIEFTDNESMIKYIDDYPNLIVTRTFSKALGAAGCRVGMVFSNKKNIELISKFRQMYEISGISMKYCSHLLDNYDIVDTYIKEVKKEKKKILKLLKNYEVIDSNCNWIHFNNSIDNKNTKEVFERYKVLTKFCSIPHDDRTNWCRMTIQPNLSDEKFIKELV